MTDYDEDGNVIGTHEEEYYTWDYYDDWTKHSKNILFCGVKFSYGIISNPNTNYITTIKESSNVRYEYYGIGVKHTGTIYTNLKNNTISNNTKFYSNMDIGETLDYCTSNMGNVIFWTLWAILIAACVYGFCYADNRWLEG